jgi:hypothetical protein
VEVRYAASAWRDHYEMQAERVCAGRRAADARLLVPDTPPAVFAVAPDDRAVIPDTGFLTTRIPTTGFLTTGALSVQVRTGRFRATRPVQPPVDQANS